MKKLPRGVMLRTYKSGEQSLNINFTYKGIKCRECLKLSITKANINYAKRLLDRINDEIERNVFNYADYFPSSNKLKIFGCVTTGVQIKHYLQEYYNSCEKRKLSPSTLDGYKKIINQLSHFHDLEVTALTPAIIKTWVQSLNITIKTIRNRLSFLKSALDFAITDGVIKINPVALVSIDKYINTERTSSYQVDPFTPDEIIKIIDAIPNQQAKNLIQFAFSSGLRSSELCALRWSDVNLDNKTAHIQNAKVVDGIMKGTKTKSGNRVIELTNEAFKALLNQLDYSHDQEFVFLDYKKNEGWQNADAIRKKVWVPALKKAEIRYRNQYQTRHTFATSQISQGANLFWLAQQMGHKGPEMLFRKYGSYLKEHDKNYQP